MTRPLLRALFSLAALPASAAADTATAQTWPDHPVKVILGSSAGSSIDFVTRTYTQYLSNKLNQSVIVENRPGANGEIATQAAARSRADGYTLLSMANNSLIHQAAGKSKQDVRTDFQILGLAGRSPWAVSVASSAPFKSLRDVVDFGRREPGKLTYASIGGGSVPDYIAQKLSESGKIDLLAVPYASTSDARVDVLTGRVNLWITAMATVLTLNEAGQVRVLTVSGDAPPEALKNVPTMTQAGFPALNAESLYFFLTPAGTAPAIVERLNLEINNAQQDAGVLEKLRSQGVFPRLGKTADSTRVVLDELALWTKVMSPGTAK